MEQALQVSTGKIWLHYLMESEVSTLLLTLTVRV